MARMVVMGFPALIVGCPQLSAVSFNSRFKYFVYIFWIVFFAIFRQGIVFAQPRPCWLTDLFLPPHLSIVVDRFLIRRFFPERHYFGDGFGMLTVTSRQPWSASYLEGTEDWGGVYYYHYRYLGQKVALGISLSLIPSHIPAGVMEQVRLFDGYIGELSRFVSGGKFATLELVLLSTYSRKGISDEEEGAYYRSYIEKLMSDCWASLVIIKPHPGGMDVLSELKVLAIEGGRVHFVPSGIPSELLVTRLIKAFPDIQVHIHAFSPGGYSLRNQGLPRVSFHNALRAAEPCSDAMRAAMHYLDVV